MELSMAVASCIGFAAGATFAILATHDREYYNLILRLRKIQRRCHRRKQEAKQHKLKVALVAPVTSGGSDGDVALPSTSECETGLVVATTDAATAAANSATANATANANSCPSALIAFNGQTLAALQDPNRRSSDAGDGAFNGPFECFLHDVERASIYSSPDSLPSLCSSDTESDVETPSPSTASARPLFLQIWGQPGLPEPEP